MAFTQIIHTSCSARVPATMDCAPLMASSFSQCVIALPQLPSLALIDVYKQGQNPLDNRYPGAQQCDIQFVFCLHTGEFYIHSPWLELSILVKKKSRRVTYGFRPVLLTF